MHPGDWTRHADGRRIYQALTSLAKHFVTTNYDYWLDSALPLTPSAGSDSSSKADPPVRVERDCIFEPAKILISELDRDGATTVTHLHGSLKDPSTMVLTTKDYIERYAYRKGPSGSVDNNTTQIFLEHLFRLKNVLFVGYGLDELEILEYVILKAQRDFTQGERVAKHFILLPFFSHELEIATAVEAYFLNECGVTLIPFLRDSKDYAQLIDVLESFAREISAGSLLHSERRYTMERLLDG